MIGLFSVDGMKPGEVSTYLFEKHKIHSTSMEWENISGVRITPSVYTTYRDLDKLVLAIGELSKKSKG